MPHDLPLRAWVELDREALAHNVAVLRRLLPPHCTLMPAVKANAYGHGAVPVARELNRLGLQAFCVATAQEGAELRAGGVQGEILVLGYTHPQQARLLHQNHLTQTVVDHSYGMALEAQNVPLEVHLKLDTGMHRLGEGPLPTCAPPGQPPRRTGPLPSPRGGHSAQLWPGWRPRAAPSPSATCSPATACCTTRSWGATTPGWASPSMAC